MSRIPYEGAPVSQTPAVSLSFQIATFSSFSFNNVNHFTYDRYFKTHIPIYYDSEETWMDRWENYAQQRVLLNGWKFGSESVPPKVGEKLRSSQKMWKIGQAAPQPRPHPASAVSSGRNLRLRPKPSLSRLSIFNPPPQTCIRLLSPSQVPTLFHWVTCLIHLPTILLGLLQCIVKARKWKQLIPFCLV